MKKAKVILNKILRPPVGIRITLPIISFAGLIYIFACNRTKSTLDYVFYALSTYSLVILVIDLIKIIPEIKNKTHAFIVKKSESVKFLNSYLTDKKFKGNVSLYQSAITDAFYTVFKLITGIIYSSVWFISLAVYHLFLGFLRVYLIICGRKKKFLAKNSIFEYNCYKRIAWFLFLLNIPMIGMIILMVRTNSGFSYPDYVIYFSATYTFYTAITAVINLVKFRNVGSPILSSAKALNFITAMMSVLGLQTAMIAAFSVNQETFRQTINAITGGAITLTGITLAVYMIIKAKKKIKELKSGAGEEYEQVGKQVL